VSLARLVARQLPSPAATSVPSPPLFPLLHVDVEKQMPHPDPMSHPCSWWPALRVGSDCWLPHPSETFRAPVGLLSSSTNGRPFCTPALHSASTRSEPHLEEGKCKVGRRAKWAKKRKAAILPTMFKNSSRHARRPKPALAPQAGRDIRICPLLVPAQMFRPFLEQARRNEGA